ncbi:MAG: cell division protein FtsX [Acetobacteraceae bacterium]|nr:cell division protein FtsX [Acetobacteraceae bacterium]
MTARRDPLGLSRALPPRLIPSLVAAMALLAGLALGGAEGAAALAERWRGAASALTVALPPEAASRLEEAAARIRALPGIAEARPVDPARLAELLRPWLGEQPALPLPPLLELRLRAGAPDESSLAAAIARAVPGAELERPDAVAGNLRALAVRLQALALFVLLLVGAMGAAVTLVATRAALAARQDAIALLHDLGATRGEIAGRVARRLAWQAGLGGLAGAGLAAPVLAGLASVAAPLAGGQGAPPYAGLLLLPPAAALLAYATAAATVRRFLRDAP